MNVMIQAVEAMKIIPSNAYLAHRPLFTNLEREILFEKKFVEGERK